MEVNGQNISSIISYPDLGNLVVCANHQALENKILPNREPSIPLVPRSHNLDPSHSSRRSQFLHSQLDKLLDFHQPSPKRQFLGSDWHYSLNPPPN